MEEGKGGTASTTRKGGFCLAYEPEYFVLLGHRGVEVKWQETMKNPEDAGEHRDGIIRVIRDQRHPVSTLAHELIHAYNSLTGHDEVEKLDVFTPHYESMLNDLVINHWELLKALRKEVQSK